MNFKSNKDYFSEKELGENNLTSWLTEYERERILKPRTRKEDEVYRMKAIAEQYLRGKAMSKELHNESRRAYMSRIKMCHITFDKEYFEQFKILCGLVPVNTMIKQLMKNYVNEMTTR